MTTYEILIRDREQPIVIEADHMEIEKDSGGWVIGYDFTRKSKEHPNVSIAPVRVLYVLADRVDTVRPVYDTGTGAQKPTSGSDGSKAADPDVLMKRALEALMEGFREGLRGRH